VCQCCAEDDLWRESNIEAESVLAKLDQADSDADSSGSESVYSIVEEEIDSAE